MAEFREDGKTVILGTDYCPLCNYKIDSASRPNDDKAVPVPGDFTICLNCGDILMFADDMALIVAPKVLIDKLSFVERFMIERNIEAINSMKKENGFVVGDFRKK